MALSRLCPICKRPFEAGEDALRFRPFCSMRCANIDLGRWLKGRYAIPTGEAEEGDSEAPDRDAEALAHDADEADKASSSGRGPVEMRGWTGRRASSKKPGPFGPPR